MRNYKGLEGVINALRWVLGDLKVNEEKSIRERKTMKIEERMSLTYDDISIIPTWSNIGSRSDCELYTDIGHYSLSTPLIASPMDTVCGVDMCVELSKLGGMGVLHRFQNC